jgi:paraquat-inducible protein A
METKIRSLRERYPKRFDVPLFLWGALLLLPFGLLLPTVTLSKMGGASEQDFSVVTGIVNFAREGNFFLALIIFVFSFLFPIVKLTTLFILWFRRLSPESRDQSLLHLRALGKWSMLDVFVVMVFTGSVQFGFLTRAYPRYGLYLFSGAVLLSMVATFLEFRLARGEAPEEGSEPRGPSLVVLPVAFLALLFLVAGFALPLMETKKWVFWKVDYSVMTATLAMVREGQYLLAGMMGLFVIVVPTLALSGQVLLVLLRRFGRRTGRLLAILGFLDRWTMMDVFALGLLIVLVKIGAVADVSPRVGLASLILGVIFSGATSWLIRG